MNSRIRRIAMVAASVAFIVIGVTRTAGQTNSVPERFTAFAVNMGDWGPTQSGTVEIVVTRWSTKGEHDMFDRRVA